MIYEGKAITVKLLEDGIAELNFDLQGESVNKFDRVTLEDLKASVAALKDNSDVKGLVVTSSKDVFIVGADITEFGDAFKNDEETIIKWVLESNDIFNGVEDLPFPTITAINGMALGGGFEMCLATDFRVMSEKAKVGLPEVKLGLYPGFGGTVRLPRVIGGDNAIEWICMGAEHRAAKALKFNAVDAVVAPEAVKDAAIAMLKEAIAGSLDWKAKRVEKTSKLNLEPLEQMMTFETAKGFVAGQTKGQYPAPVEAIKTMQKAANFGREKALEVEAKGFAKLAKTTESAALIGLFNNDQLLKKKSKRIRQDC